MWLGKLIPVFALTACVLGQGSFGTNILPPVGAPPISRGPTVCNVSSTPAVTVTGLNIAVGDTVVVGLHRGGTTAVNVIDSGNNTYASRATSSQVMIASTNASGVTTAATSVTATNTGTPTIMIACVTTYRNVATMASGLGALTGTQNWTVSGTITSPNGVMFVALRSLQGVSSTVTTGTLLGQMTNASPAGALLTCDTTAPAAGTVECAGAYASNLTPIAGTWALEPGAGAGPPTTYGAPLHAPIPRRHRATR